MDISVWYPIAVRVSEHGWLLSTCECHNHSQAYQHILGTSWWVGMDVCPSLGVQGTPEAHVRELLACLALGLESQRLGYDLQDTVPDSLLQPGLQGCWQGARIG